MRLWLRTDGSPTMGLGHVMRCVALAEAAAERSIASVFVTRGDPAAHRSVERRGFRVVEPTGWPGPVAAGDAVVFDGYHFTDDDLESAAAMGATIGVVDDLAERTFAASVTVNPNPIEGDVYDRAHGTVLVGPRYALVREEFRRRRRRRAGRLRTLLLTLGGSDAAAIGVDVLRCLERDPPERVVHVVGPAARPAAVPRWVEHVRDPRDVGGVFDRADAALSAAGSTTWELLCMGLPVALVQVADNQAPIGPAVSDAGAGVFVGKVGAELCGRILTSLASLSSGDLSARSAAALDLVDGHGARRVIEALLTAP